MEYKLFTHDVASKHIPQKKMKINSALILILFDWQIF